AGSGRRGLYFLGFCAVQRDQPGIQPDGSKRDKGQDAGRNGYRLRGTSLVFYSDYYKTIVMIFSIKALKRCLAAGLLLSALSGSAQSPMSIDHRYSPPWWQTLICLPDDPVKTLVGKEGQVFGDYDYKGPRSFSFSIAFDSRLPAAWKSQALPSALVPMTVTQKKAGAIAITEKTFLEIPGSPALNSIERYD